MSGGQQNQQGAIVNPQRPLGIPSPVELGYWHIRGLAAPIRMVLVINGVEFENTTYKQVMEGTKASTKSWDDAKKAMQESFPLVNLPYLRAGRTMLVQSMAILAYLGEAFNMLGSTPEERAQCHMVLNQAMDWRNASVRLWYAPADRYEASRKTYLERGLSNEVGKLARYLEQSRRPYFAGDKPTVCDFPMWELIDQHENFEPGCIFNTFPVLREFYQRFAQQPGVRYFLGLSLYRDIPINNITANWAREPLPVPSHLAQLQGR